MLWYLPWSENIKKRACRYLLQRYLGNFLEQKLTLDQLSVDLYNGTGTVSDVSIDCEALNELGDTQNWPLEIIDGYMKEITVTIPWSTLLKDDSVVQVNGLSVTVQPKVRAEPASSMLESMWSSMSSSMQLAAECLRQEDVPPDSNPVEGIEMFAHAIDSILSRVKVKFINTKIRIEHVPKNGDKGIALEIHIKHIDYYDEAGSEPPPEMTDPEKTKTYIVSTFTNKKVLFEGVTLYTDEFPSKFRTMARSVTMEKSVSSQQDKLETSQTDDVDVNFESTMSDVFYETRSVISEPDTKDPLEHLSPNATPNREISPDERLNQPDPILFAKITGQQELAFKIKHSAELSGPKVDLQMTLGSLIVFLTPRQLHSLIELVEGINQPHLEDTSNIPLRPSGLNLQCKPMRQADFQIIEAQLLGNFNDGLSHNIRSHGWSGQSFEDSDVDSENFQPMRSANQMADSFTSSVSSMSASVTSSVNIPTPQPRLKRNKKVPQIDGDPTAEVSHIHIKIASCSCILLHKDILVSMPLGTDYVTAASSKEMEEASTEFFERLGLFAISGHGRRDFEIANEILDKATTKNHLRLILTSLTVEGSEKTTSHGSQTSCEAIISHLLLRECLYYNINNEFKEKPETFDLVHFNTSGYKQDDSSECVTSIQPDVTISFKQTLKYVRIAGERKLLHPTTDLSVKCAPLFIDVELTLIERMQESIFGSTTYTSSHNKTGMRTQNQLNLTLTCPNLDAILRFPIADLRSGVNRQARRVRSDYLKFKFGDVALFCQQPQSLRPTPLTLTIQASTIDLYYHESECDAGTHVAQANVGESYDPHKLPFQGSNTTLPTISITFQPKKTAKGPFDSSSDEEPMESNLTSGNQMTQSIYIMDKLKDNSQPSPFSSKKMAHQSITTHENENQGAVEELVVPGNEKEMLEFTQHSVEHSSIHLELNFPVLSLQLESKQIYEIIYNRINSDLLLWEPQTINQFDISPHIGHPIFSEIHEPNIYPAFSMCKSGLEYDSGSSSSSDEENVYFSTYDQKQKQKRPAIQTKQPLERKGSHDFCFTLKINKGLLTVFAPVRDSNKRVVPGQTGELVIEAYKLFMCQVSGVNGRAKHALMCLRANDATLHHAALISSPSEKPVLRLYGNPLPSHLKETIYPSGKGVFLKDTKAKKDMLSLALNVEPHKDISSFKKICMALGIENATLRHRGNTGIAWLSQLLDVIDVMDYPVPGYQPSTVLTELHIHIWDCAIDYRPLYLPIRTVLTLGNFSVSSNVIAQTNTSNLRFLAQECAMFLSHIPGTKPGLEVPLDEDKHPDLHNDYVCVMDIGLFELSLRMTDKSNTTGPHVELCASNNAVNLRTCWDSASALCRLVTYIAVDGDTQPPEDAQTASRHASFCSDRTDEPLIGLEEKPEDIREISPSEMQQVNDLMAEAMKESPNTTQDEEELNASVEKEGVKVFYFPDESNNFKQLKRNSSDDSESKSLEYEEFSNAIPEIVLEEKPTNVQVAKELGDPTSAPKSPQKPPRKAKSSDGGNTDDEYCIIDGHTSEDDDLVEPVAKWFDSEPVPMVENHFSIPVAKTDVLKAPKNFPIPILRYTLCEMSIIWHMFGGTDFKSATDTQKKRNVTISEGEYRTQGSPTPPKRKGSYEPYESGRATAAAYRQTGVAWAAGHERVRPRQSAASSGLNWRTRGGENRDHRTLVQLHLSKVKFQHESYGAGTHAARQTLAIGKLEVHDRLAISHINKFLSQYLSNDEPERKHAHMLVIKAVHLRPDPALLAQECCLKISLLPLRFHIDQDTLAFLMTFFSKLGSDEPNEDDNKSLSGTSTDSSSSRQATPTHRAPVMGVASHLRHPPPPPLATATAPLDADFTEHPLKDKMPLMENYEAERLVSENLIVLEEDFQKMSISNEGQTARAANDTEPVDDSPLYFRRVVFAPEVPIRLDYVGKRVDLSSGPIAGLIMGLGQLNCSELRLKRLYHRHGLLGLERLVRWALQEWLADIKRHQLPGLLSGIGPMHSLLQFVTGIRDLLWLPVEQWRRDGRLVHGLRRGAASFTARTAVAALDITARLLHVIQATAETAFDMLTPGPTLQLQDAYDRRERRRRRRRDPARQPADIREGVASAYHTVREGFAETATTMAIVARSERGVGVLRHLPGAAVAPVALAAAGVADVVGGMRAHLAPDLRRDHADKWRPHTQTQFSE